MLERDGEIDEDPMATSSLAGSVVPVLCDDGIDVVVTLDVVDSNVDKGAVETRAEEGVVVNFVDFVVSVPDSDWASLWATTPASETELGLRLLPVD